MPKLCDGEILVQEVKGMLEMTEIGSAAQVTRLWWHWFKHLVMPMLSRCRDANELKDQLVNAMRMMY
jgi:hypothetical protein